MLTVICALCNENRLNALLPLIYFVNQLLHVSCITTAHHQEVFTVYVQQLVPPDDRHWVYPKHVEVDCLNKLRVNSASSWFSLQIRSRCTVSKTYNL
jgi:hypothetical protein